MQIQKRMDCVKKRVDYYVYREKKELGKKIADYYVYREKISRVRKASITMYVWKRSTW